jgi:hypothetical protein
LLRLLPAASALFITLVGIGITVKALLDKTCQRSTEVRG